MGFYETGQILPTAQRGLPQGQGSDTDAAAVSSPGFGTTFGAAYNSATDQTWSVQQLRINDAYTTLADELSQATGKDAGAYYLGGRTDTRPSPYLVWQEINARRQTDPGFLKNVGADQAAFEKNVYTRKGQSQIDAATAGAGGWLANLAGTAAAAWHDPFQVAAMFLGGPEVSMPARGIIANGLARVGMAGATNAAFATAEEPLAIQARSNMGQATTPGDVAGDIAGAAAFGAGLHAASEVAAPIVSNVREAALSRIYGALPDQVLANHFANRTAPWERTPEEQAALNVLGRQAEVAATNPYGASHAAMAVHGANLGDAVSAIDRGTVPGAAVAPASPTSGAFSPDYYAKLAHAENATGNPNASPGTTSARGLYQFTDATWLNSYKARFGSGGQTDAQILALKTNADLQQTLVRDLTRHNAAYLDRHGVTPDDANLYLAHFAGPDDAVKLAESNPAIRAADVMRPASVDANPWLRDKTVGELRVWAERKMGGAADAGIHAASAIADDDGSAGLARSDAEDARIEADEMQTAAVDHNPAAIDAEPPSPMPAAPVVPDHELPMSVQMLLPALRQAIDDRTVKLNDMNALASQMGASSEDIRTGLSELVQQGELRQRADNGNFMRHPQGDTGPEDVLRFIARLGGLRDDEGHNLGLKRLKAIGDQSVDDQGDLIGTSAANWRKEIDDRPSPQRQAEIERQGRYSTKDWGRIMTRSGPLLRRAGRSIDQVGEAIHEAGYMAGERPTTREVIDYLDQRITSGKPAYTLEDQARMGAGDGLYRLPTRDEHMAYQREQMARVAREDFGIAGHELDDEFLDHAASLAIDRGMDEREAFLRAVNDFADQVRHEAMDEKDTPDYRNIDHEWPDHPRPGNQDVPTEADLAGSRPLTSDEAAGGRGAEAARGDPGERTAGPIDPTAYAEYSEPDSPRIAQAADSAWHDIEARLAGVDPAIAERAKQETVLQAEAPLRGENKTGVAQEGTMGLGLFDASDQPVFDLEPGDSTAKIEAIRNALESDQNALDTLSSCLLPKMGGK